MRSAWRRNLNEFVLYFQGSADSNYSQPSSDLSLDEEKESLRREKERQALNQLEKARVSHWSFACSSFTSLSLSLFLYPSLSPFFSLHPPSLFFHKPFVNRFVSIEQLSIVYVPSVFLLSVRDEWEACQWISAPNEISSRRTKSN